jgi:transposase
MSGFVPVLVEPGLASSETRAPRRVQRRRKLKSSAVELEIDGVAVRIAASAEKQVISMVIEAFKATG